MKCPYCSTTDNKVLESRMNQTGEITRRRRECIACAGRFTTYERVESVMPMVVKKDGRRETFEREKILDGIQKACQKRPIKIDQIEKIVSGIESKMASFSLKELPSRIIGQLVMAALHDLDTVAYIRFASVYREFKDVEEFVEELKEMPTSVSSQEMIFDIVPEDESGKALGTTSSPENHK